jgi:hypothetical protein
MEVVRDHVFTLEAAPTAAAAVKPGKKKATAPPKKHASR